MAKDLDAGQARGPEDLKEMARQGLLPRLEYRWDVWMSRIEGGDHPSEHELAYMLRKHWTKAPRAAQLYVAGLVDGSLRRSVGRPKADPLNKLMHAADVTMRVRLHQAAFRVQKIAAPRQRAVALVAKHLSLAPDTVDDIARRGLKGSPHSGLASVPIAEFEEWVKRQVAQGATRLDPEEGLLVVGTDVDQ